MQITDINKTLPVLDKKTLTAGQYEFAKAQSDMIKKTIENVLYGVSAGFQQFWTPNLDCTTEEKFQSLGTSLKMFFVAHEKMALTLNELAIAANAKLPEEHQIQPLVLPDIGTITFKEDGSLLSYTPPIVPPVEPSPV